MRIEIDDEGQTVELILEPHVAVDKSPMLLNPIQDSLDLHPVVRLRELVCVGTAILSEWARDASSIDGRGGVWKLPAPWTAQNAAHRALENPQNGFPTSFHNASVLLSSQKTTDKNSLHPPGLNYPQILRRRPFSQREVASPENSRKPMS
jgi:hypothetical protein